MANYELHDTNWLPGFDRYVKTRARSGHRIIAQTRAQLELAEKRAERLKPGIRLKFELRESQPTGKKT